MLITFMLICLSQYFYHHTTSAKLHFWITDNGMLILFGVWLIGMSAQLIGLLKLALGYQQIFDRISKLEEIRDSSTD